jgi:hypothetical protein
MQRQRWGSLAWSHSRTLLLSFSLCFLPFLLFLSWGQVLSDGYSTYHGCLASDQDELILCLDPREGAAHQLDQFLFHADWPGNSFALSFAGSIEVPQYFKVRKGGGRRGKQRKEDKGGTEALTASSPVIHSAPSSSHPPQPICLYSPPSSSFFPSVLRLHRPAAPSKAASLRRAHTTCSPPTSVKETHTSRAEY